MSNNRAQQVTVLRGFSGWPGPVRNNAQLRLFFGNPKAEPPNNDFARSLPDRRDPEPTRAKLEKCLLNPRFVPPPKPLTERWPWLIYVVLGTASTILALIIISLALQTIALHDRQSDRQGTQHDAV